MPALRYGAAGASDGGTYGWRYAGYGVYYGDYYRTGPPDHHAGGTYGPYSTPPLGRDITLMVGRSRADYLVGSLPTVTRGETLTLDLGFDPDGLPHYRARYNQLRDRLEYAADAAVAIGTTQDGTPWFAEQHGREQLLVKVLPGRDLDEVRGFWGVLMGGDDSTTLPGAQARLSVDVFVLARLGAYSEHQQVREALER